jgi:hypothetical protein
MAAKKTKPSAAQALIAKATAAKDALPARARAELAALMEHNDGATQAQRVSADAALAMLATLGVQMGRSKFDQVIKREFGRKWGAQ